MGATTDTLTIEDAGLADAASYDLRIIGPCASRSTRYAQLTVRCPSDFDADGFVTGLDFDAFVAAYESGDLSSDFDHDGFVTGLDFDAYVQAFEDGC